MLAAKIVVEDPTVGGFVNVRLAEVHAVALDGAGDATDEDDGTIRFLPLDDSDVCQRVVCLAVSVIVPGIIEEDEIAGAGDRSLVERALLPYVGMDEADAIGVWVVGAALIEIDPVFEINGAGNSRAVIGDAPAVALNRFRTDEGGRCPHYCAPAERQLSGSTAGACLRGQCARAFGRLYGTAHERYARDSRDDEEESH